MFSYLKSKMQARFAELVANGPLLHMNLDRDKIWETYLQAIPENLRQSNNCNCCKTFLRQYGGIVGIGPDSKVMTLWDFPLDDAEYGEAVKALRRYVSTCDIVGPFYSPLPKCGTDTNPDRVNNVVWSHFFVVAPNDCIRRESDIASLVGDVRETKNVMLRSVNELKPDAVETVLDLIRQGSLYRGTEFKVMVEEFQKAQKAARLVRPELRGNHCWKVVAATYGRNPILRIRNTAIGTLLINLSEGMDLDRAVAAFERVVAPSNYKRPTALVTPKMIESAKARVEELGFAKSLQRRMLTDRDLTVDNTLHVFRRQGPAVGDVFDQLKTQTPINPRSLSKVEEVSIEDFVEKVLPTAKSVRALLENSHLSNLVSLVGPVDPEAPTMFKWGNGFSWSYVGEMADSIKERVKAAGGNVSGVLRISLSWHNHDDLDLHVIEPDGFEICYVNRSSMSGGTLDVDMNAGRGTSRQPVENIFWTREPTKRGTYRVVVNQYCKRDTSDDGFEVELEYKGETYHFSSSVNKTSGHNHNVFEFVYDPEGITVRHSSGPTTSKYSSQEKWGLKTGLFHAVKAITLSPNHWTGAVGNKHYFFLLQGAKSDDKVRPFYNEFLKPELDQDRKVLELIGANSKVEPTENELSGIGFSDTVRNHLYVEVEGSFKRTIKIKF